MYASLDISVQKYTWVELFLLLHERTGICGECFQQDYVHNVIKSYHTLITHVVIDPSTEQLTHVES